MGQINTAFIRQRDEFCSRRTKILVRDYGKVGPIVSVARSIRGLMPSYRAVFVATLVLSLCATIPLLARAARYDAPTKDSSSWESLFEWSPLVRDIQELLIEFELFPGPANGRLTVETRKAIRAYQKNSNLSVDGKPDDELLTHMNNVGRAESLKQRLQEARNQQIEEARAALANNPATRDLVGTRAERRAKDSQGTGQTCLRTPTVNCLLEEALSAIDSITRDDYRDWALRDVIRAQARAGRTDEARNSIRRLSDLRLVIVSLRETAVALAEAGRIDEASALTATIPDTWNKARALLAIAKAETDGSHAYDALLKLLPLLADEAAAVEIAAELAIDLAKGGATKRAEKAISVIDNLPDGTKLTDVQRITLSAIATAYARIGHSKQAMRTLARIGETSRDDTALAEAAGLLAKNEKTSDALAAADRLRTPQLYVLALTKIAAAQLQLGNRTAARDSLKRAKSASVDIKRPFAADTALARIATVWSNFPDYPTAFKNVNAIKSHSLKAQTIWRFAVNASSPIRAANEANIMPRAVAATDSIESPFDRAATLARAAIEFAKKRQTKDAKAVFAMAVREARAIRNNWWRARIFSLLATALITI